MRQEREGRLFTVPLATASLSAVWLGKGNPAISEIRDTLFITYMLFINVGVMVIDDSLSDDRQFFGGEFVSYGSVLLWRPCRANFCPSAVPISVLLPLRQGHFLAIPGIELRHAPGLSWVLAIPDRVASWHGDCAFAGGENGYQDRAESSTEALG